jgi:hypothetical protein
LLFLGSQRIVAGNPKPVKQKRLAIATFPPLRVDRQHGISSWPPGPGVRLVAEPEHDLTLPENRLSIDLWDVMPCLRGLLAQQPELEGTMAHLLKKLNGMAAALEISALRGVRS